MDSFVEAQNSLKRMSDGGCVTLLQSHAVRFVHTCGHEVAGLKTYRDAKRKEQFGVRMNGWRYRRYHGAGTAQRQAAAEFRAGHAKYRAAPTEAACCRPHRPGVFRNRWVAVRRRDFVHAKLLLGRAHAARRA